MPKVGNAGFLLLCDDAPPNVSSGFAVLSAAQKSPPLIIRGAEVFVSLGGEALMLAATSNGRGASDVPLPLPNVPSLAGAVLYSQFFWFGPGSPPPCPPMGLSASQALRITVQP
jgi:hypothetical protein